MANLRKKCHLPLQTQPDINRPNHGLQWGKTKKPAAFFLNYETRNSQLDLRDLVILVIFTILEILGILRNPRHLDVAS